MKTPKGIKGIALRDRAINKLLKGRKKVKFPLKDDDRFIVIAETDKGERTRTTFTRSFLIGESSTEINHYFNERVKEDNKRFKTNFKLVAVYRTVISTTHLRV